MELHVLFITIGGLLLVGLATDELGRRTRLPRVTLLMLFGVAAGPTGFDLLPAELKDWYEFLASTALTMVAFLLGGKLSLGRLRLHGRQIIAISLAVVAVTALTVAGGLAAIGVPLVLALLLAGIATATDPAATEDVVRQTGAGGPFTGTLQGVVAVDDAWGLIAFSLLLVAAKAIAGDGSLAVVLEAARELGGAAAIGLAIGVPAAYLTGRLRPGEPVQAEALGVVFLCAGLSLFFDVSFLLAGMICGTVVVNLARHHNRPFHEIEHVEWPFMVLFFVLAGGSLDLAKLGEAGAIGAAFLVLRLIGRVVGGLVGGRSGDAPATHRRWIGLALVPQAGVAIGMALVAADHFPQLRETLLAVAIGTTIVCEVAGPILTQQALRATGEARRP
jgi:Kef-type K+ transport system membrane component KefB